MPRKHGLKAGALFAILAAMLIAAAWMSSLAAATGDQSEIEATVSTSMMWMQGFAATPDGHLAKDTTLGKAEADAKTALRALYTGPLLTTRVDQIQGALQQQAAGALLVFGGGVSRLQFKTIVIQGSSATVSVDATTWSDIGERLADGSIVRSRPTNTEEFTFQLVRTGTTWLISGESVVFAPGSEP